LVLGARNSARLEALTERITDAGGHYGRTDVTRRAT
jgi:NADP-dependent 3-hydroxy acid dehydrogenase YdfG